MSTPSLNLIAASAGSGKTFQLTKRYAELLFNGNDISSILAVTFTDNAAKEMKTRIIQLLKNCALKNSQAKVFFENYQLYSQKSRNILDTLFERYNLFNVRTIDSFIASVFSLSSFELGHTPDINIKFNYRGNIDDFIFSFLSEIVSSKQTEMLDEFINFINETENSFIFDPTSKLIENFSWFFKKEDDYLAWLMPQEGSEKEKLNQLENTGRKILEKLKILFERYSSQDFYTAISDAVNAKDPYPAAKEIVKKGKVIKNKKIIVPKEIEEELVELSKQYLILRAEIFYAPYTNIFLRFREYFRKESKRTRSFILSSMVREIKRMIEDNKHQAIQTVMMRLSTNFKHFMIDEFQDTSYAQWSILKPFIEEALSCGGSCFLIGDIKQAIYMFRNADYRIMKDMIENPKDTIYIDTSPLKDGIQVLTTTENYRSSPVILDYINNFFGSERFENYLESNGFGGFKKIYNIKHTPQKKDDGYVKTTIIEEGLKDQIIKIIKDCAARFPLSSIAVLSYTNNTLKEVAGWLADEDINCISYSQLDLRENSIVLSIINLMRFINDLNEFSFSKFIFSQPFIKISGIERDKIENVMMDAMINEESKITAFKNSFPEIWKSHFEYLIEESRRCDIYSLLKSILSLYKISEFSDYSGYILKLMDLTSLLIKEENLYSLSDFVDFIDNSNEDDERFYVDVSSAVDAVKLMTFHKAKGLEFDVVINIFKQTKRGGSRIFYGIDGEKINLYALNESTIKADKRLEDIYFSNVMDEKVAEINTVYVALTRAKKELYNIVVDEPRGLDIFDVFENYTSGIKTSFEKTEKKTDEFMLSMVNHTKKTLQIVRPTSSIEADEGRIYHRAMSLILSGFSNGEDAIRKAFVFEKVGFKKEIFERVKKLIERTLSDNAFISLVRGYKIKSEIEFAADDGGIVRSDLVVEKEKEVNVIDFKTGQPEPSDILQVKKYIKALKEIYRDKDIIGYLYYPQEKKIVEVKHTGKEDLW